MAFVTGTTTASNIPLVTGNGGGLWRGLSSATPRVINSGGVPILAGHFRSPLDGPLLTGTTQQVTPAALRQLELLAWYAGQVANGVAGPVMWNANWSAGNISEELSYELTGASGSSITLRGRHPLRVPFQRLVANPDWPFEGPRFFVEVEEGSIPVGAEVRFAWPSVLSGKLCPIITAINVGSSSDPDETVWTATLSAPVGNAMVPYDAAWGAVGLRYSVRIFFYRQQAPLPGEDLHEPVQVAWLRVGKSVLAEELDEAGRYLLTDTDGEPKRVFLPSLAAGRAQGAIIAAIAYRPTGSQQWIVLRDQEVEGRMTHQWTEGEHRTWLALGDLMPGADEMRLTYLTEMREADRESFTGGFRCGGACLNSRAPIGVSVGGSPLGEVCHAPESTGNQAGLHHAGCWLPGGQCSHFAPRRLDGTVAGTLGTPGVLTTANGLWDRVTVGHDIQFEQGLPGFSNARNFTLRRPAGAQASLTSLCGAWQAYLPTGLYALREPFFPSRFHRRVTTEHEGSEYHQLVGGAWWSRPWVGPDATTRDAFNAASPLTAPQGVLPRLTAMASSRTPPAGAAYPPSVPEVDGYVLPHLGGHRLYEGTNVSGRPALRLIEVPSEKVCPAWSPLWAPSDELAALVDEILA